jgi:hypothetical protein
MIQKKSEGSLKSILKPLHRPETLNPFSEKELLKVKYLLY